MKCISTFSGGKELEGELVKSNFYTVIMRVYCPKKKIDKIIRRHKKRHCVNILSK